MPSHLKNKKQNFLCSNISKLHFSVMACGLFLYTACFAVSSLAVLEALLLSKRHHSSKSHRPSTYLLQNWMKCIIRIFTLSCSNCRGNRWRSELWTELLGLKVLYNTSFSNDWPIKSKIWAAHWIRYLKKGCRMLKYKWLNIVIINKEVLFLSHCCWQTSNSKPTDPLKGHRS